MLSRRDRASPALTAGRVRRETPERLRRIAKGGDHLLETQQNGALIMLIWTLCLVAIVGLIVGYIIIKP
jgi:hypothetical protein